jgi:hypothetical protein
LLDRIGHWRFRQVRLELLASPVIPLGVKEHVRSLGEGGHSRFGNEAAAMIDVPMRYGHKIDTVRANPGALKVRLKF